MVGVAAIGRVEEILQENMIHISCVENQRTHYHPGLSSLLSFWAINEDHRVVPAHEIPRG